ncbi:unnamed protein product [Closterium sp. NIES-53]
MPASPASLRHYAHPPPPSSPPSRSPPPPPPPFPRTTGSGGKVILFVDTKSAASEFAQNLAHLGARALHGDVVQQQREVVLKAFKAGSFQVLVATDVAARGLDISDVQLVLQAQVPRTVETYIHRSGRTGRAGNTGVSVLVADRWAGRIVAQIEHTAGVKFERVSPPQPADLVRVASAAVTAKVKAVGDSVVPLFESSAQELIDSTGLSPLAALAKALACLAGHTELKVRSLLLSQQDQVTLLLRCSSSFYSPSYVLRFFEQHLTPDQTRAINGITLTADGCGAVFDVPVKDKDLYLKAAAAASNGLSNIQVEEAKTLPELKQAPMTSNRALLGSRRRGCVGRFAACTSFDSLDFLLPLPAAPDAAVTPAREDGEEVEVEGEEGAAVDVAGLVEVVEEVMGETGGEVAVVEVVAVGGGVAEGNGCGGSLYTT